jgi:outer membrane lipoprotein SlyB
MITQRSKLTARRVLGMLGTALALSACLPSAVLAHGGAYRHGDSLRHSPVQFGDGDRDGRYEDGRNWHLGNRGHRVMRVHRFHSARAHRRHMAGHHGGRRYHARGHTGGVVRSHARSHVVPVAPRHHGRVRAGGFVGAAVGGLVGSQLGYGEARVATTVIGAVGGFILGQIIDSDDGHRSGHRDGHVANRSQGRNQVVAHVQTRNTQRTARPAQPVARAGRGEGRRTRNAQPAPQQRTERQRRAPVVTQVADNVRLGVAVEPHEPGGG